MNKTLKYVLIAGGVGAVVYIAAKRLAPAPEPDKPKTVGSAIDTIVGGVTKIVNTVRSAPAPASVTGETQTRTTMMLPDNSPYAPTYGDLETEQNGKQEYLTFGNYTLPTEGATTLAQRATIGAIDGSQYAYGGLDA